MYYARKFYAECSAVHVRKSKSAVKHVLLRHALDRRMVADDLTVRACPE